MAEQFSIKDSQQKLNSLEQALQSRVRSMGGATMTMESLTRMDVKTAANASKQNVQRLDQSMQEFKDYKGSIATLAAGLTVAVREHDVYVSMIAKNQTGFERFASHIGFAKWADARLVERTKLQGPEENLKVIANFSTELVKYISEVYKTTDAERQQIQNVVDVLVEKIVGYEPIVAELKASLEVREADFKASKDKYEQAQPAEQAGMLREMNDKRKELQDIREQYASALVTYKDAKESIELNQQSRDGFEQMAIELATQAKDIQESLDNVIQLYHAAPQAQRILVATKGMELAGKAIRKGAAESVTMIANAVAGVTEATVQNEKAQFMTPEEMRYVMQTMGDSIRIFAEAQEQVYVDANRNTQERYQLGGK